jgi:hypothetical protein
MGRQMKAFLAVAIFLVAVVASGYAQDSGSKDLDKYRWRVEGNWWLSQPSGYFGRNGDNNYFNINRDFGFGRYSTFTGKIDWHFRRKHHFLFNFSPINNSRTVALNRTIEFQGEVFDLGAQVSAKIRSLNFAPGYQYDIIRRDHGFLVLEVDLNLQDTKGSLKGLKIKNKKNPKRPSYKTIFNHLKTT